MHFALRSNSLAPSLTIDDWSTPSVKQLILWRFWKSWILVTDWGLPFCSCHRTSDQTGFAVLERYLRALPGHLPWAVEVRQQAWYDSGTNEQRLDDLLRELQMDKVLFDSRALFSGPPSDDIERLSQQRKPRTPIRQTVTGGNPFLRLVGRNCLDDAVPWIREWAPVIAGWLQQGLRPWIFAHAPDDRYAPEFARRIHNHVRQLVPELPEMVPWPGEVEAQASRSAGRIVQQTLFGEDE